MAQDHDRSNPQQTPKILIHMGHSNLKQKITHVFNMRTYWNHVNRLAFKPTELEDCFMK